jgi:thiamine-phosphate diphosphorylase
MKDYCNIFNQSLEQHTFTKHIASTDSANTSAISVDFADHGATENISIKSILSAILQNNLDVCNAFFSGARAASLVKVVINDSYFTDHSSATSLAIDNTINLATGKENINIICDLQLSDKFAAALQQVVAGSIEASQQKKLEYLCIVADTVFCDQQTFKLITAIDLKETVQLGHLKQSKQKLALLFGNQTPAFIIRTACKTSNSYYYIEDDKQALFSLAINDNNALALINNLLCASFCSFQLLGKRHCDALVLALAYLQQNSKVIHSQQSSKMLDGAWPHDLNDYPLITTALNSKTTQAFATTDTLSLGLYPVVDTIQWLERLLVLGVKTIQLRIKDTEPNKLDEYVAIAAALGKKHQARLFINDYWQLAIKHKCYGVHLGQEDLDDTDLEAIQAAGLKLGISTHSEYEWLRAIAIKPSYIAMGTVYPTQTKPAILIGLDNLQHWSRVLSKHYPLVAIGGIKLANIDPVIATGVGSVAVVTAITLAADYKQAVAQLNAKQQTQALH